MEEAASTEQVRRSANAVVGMMVEGRYAEATSFLFNMHKMHLREWVAVKRELFASASSPKTLQTMATLLEASKQLTLQQSASFIPGLGALIWSNQRRGDDY